MRVKFWGTRGSIPVAPTTADIRQKLVAALTQAAGRQLDTPARIEAFVDGELDLGRRHTFGGNSSCVQLDAGDAVLRAVRSRQRRARASAITLAGHPPGASPPSITCSCPTCTGTTSWASRSSCPPTSRATASASTAATPRSSRPFRRQHGGAVVSRWTSRQLGADDRVRAARAGSPPTTSPASGSRAQRQLHSGDSYGYRFEHDGQGRDLLHRLRAQARRPARDRRVRRVLPRRRPRDLRRACTRWPTPSRSRRTGATRATSSASSCARWRGAKHLCMFHHEPTYDDATLAARARGDPRGSRRSRASGAPLEVSVGLGRHGDRSLRAMTASRAGPAPRGARRCGAAGCSAVLLVAVLAGALVAMPRAAGLERCAGPGSTSTSGHAARARRPRRSSSWTSTSRSLRALGQWPWPRTLLAQLFDAHRRRRARPPSASTS